MFLAKTKFFIGFSGTIRVNIVCNDKSNIYQKKKKKKKKKKQNKKKIKKKKKKKKKKTKKNKKSLQNG